MTFKARTQLAGYAPGFQAAIIAAVQRLSRNPATLSRRAKTPPEPANSQSADWMRVVGDTPFTGTISFQYSDCETKILILLVSEPSPAI